MSSLALAAALPASFSETSVLLVAGAAIACLCSPELFLLPAAAARR